ncbi:L-serine ammonia-lyase [Luteococcus peritonei]|uniref:L-serine dehydratase n=1 Tax=Luteococcus peritonei TaxID=88874 RepID=A0ABW4RTM8_9ACTN
MGLSVLDLFSIGIGPSSSHTVGPMRAAARFLEDLKRRDGFEATARIQAELFGSLALTGRGHGSDKATILGLMGELPESVDVERADDLVATVRQREELALGGRRTIRFTADDLTMHLGVFLPGHPNGMRFTAWDAEGRELCRKDYFSIGGGFVVDEVAVSEDHALDAKAEPAIPFDFTTGRELVEQAERHGLRISELVLRREEHWRPEAETRQALLRVWQVMQECVTAGCTSTRPTLPGGLNVPRRAPRLYQELVAQGASDDPLAGTDWIGLYALAVNEENAAGGRMVTAPTNGAAGIIPAVLHNFMQFSPRASEQAVVDFLLTAGAIGILFKSNASISGAEVGCQGEVGSACSMAAGALCDILGGSPRQVENAAEIGIEHNLGLTCDPVQGLVQIPCIERNAIAANKAVTAARMALRGDGGHLVSLDAAILTMRTTGEDMKSEYKETSTGGLALNYTVC